MGRTKRKIAAHARPATARERKDACAILKEFGINLSLEQQNRLNSLDTDIAVENFVHATAVRHLNRFDDIQLTTA